MQGPNPPKSLNLNFDFGMLGLYCERVATPPHRFRPRKIPGNSFNNLSDYVERRLALLLDHRNVEVALLVLLNLGLADRFQASGAHETGDSLDGCADFRTLALLFDVRLPRGHAVHR